MTEQTRREIIKAIAYGKKTDEICAVMNVSAEDVNSIAENEIASQRDYLRSMGYLR